MGAKKLEYVKQFLAQHGFDIDVAEIEAAVAEYINYPAPTIIEAHYEDLSPELMDDGK